MNNIFGVTMSDYGDNVVFAQDSSMSELAELQKALSAGEITGRETTGRTDVPGATLKVEDLENTLKNLTYKESDIKLWKRISKLPAFNTVEEYNQQLEYGTDGYSFTDEGGLPEDDSPMYKREAQMVKYLGTTRSVSHPMQLVATQVGDLMQKEIQNGTLKILRDVDRALWQADSTIIKQEFNGFKQQQIVGVGGLSAWSDSDVVIDLRGQALSEKVLENGALAIIQNNGEGNLLFAPPQALSAFKNTLIDQKKIYIGNGTEGNLPNAGLQVQKFLSQFGFIDLEYDKFMAVSNRYKTLTTPATNSKAPAQPVADATTPLAATTDTKNLFSDTVGSYKYAVSAINKYGESKLTSMGAAIATAATKSIDLKFAAGGDSPAGYTIYRTKDATSDIYYPIFKVSVADMTAGYDGGGEGIVRDRNRNLPGCEECFLVDASDDVWSFKQLAPLMKMDLAVLSPATRFMLLLYGTPILYAPKKLVTFKNVGI